MQQWKNRSVYLIPGRLADVLAAIQVMAAGERPEKEIKDWANELDRNRDPSTIERWTKVFTDHREFFLVYKLPGKDELKAALRWRYVNKQYDAKSGREYTPAEIQDLPDELRGSLTTKPLSVDGISALMNSAIDLHNRAIEELGSRRWWLPILVVVLGGLLTLAGNAYFSFYQSQYQFRLSFSQKNAELALQIMQRDPSQTSAQLRAWAISVLENTPNIPIALTPNKDLMKAPPPNTPK